MRFCQEHWDPLREAIDERGLMGFVPDNGEQAMKQMVDEMETGTTTVDNFDPLMGAHWAIATNAMKILGEQGGPQAVMYLMAGPDVPEDPVKGYDGYEGRTWPRCPLCYLNLAHEVSCNGEGCTLDKERGFDWMIGRAADEQLERYEKELGSEGRIA